MRLSNRNPSDIVAAQSRISYILHRDRLQVVVFLKRQLNNGAITMTVEPARHKATQDRIAAWAKHPARAVVGTYDIKAKPTYIKQDLRAAMDELTEREAAA